MYTNRQLGKELKEQLTDPYDPIQVARWADSLHYVDMPKELYDIVCTLEFMSMEPAFEFTKEELTTLADQLIHKKKYPLRHLLHMKGKRTGYYLLQNVKIYRQTTGQPISDRWLGEELKQRLAGPYDPSQVASWADSLHYLEMSDELYYIVITLEMLWTEPEFEFTKEGLMILADKLINNEKDPLQQVQNIQRKRSSSR